MSWFEVIFQHSVNWMMKWLSETRDSGANGFHMDGADWMPLHSKNRTILPRNLTILLARFWQGLGWFAYEKSTEKSPYGFLETHLRSVRAFQTTTPESGVRSRWEGGRHLRYNCSILCEMICEQRRFRVQRYATIAYLPHRTYIHTAIPYIRFFHKRVLKLHSYMLIGSLIHICNYLI